MCPHPCSQRVGDITWEPSGFPGLKWVGKCPPPLLLLLLLWSRRASPACLSWSPWSPSYAPRTHAAWRGLWRTGDQPGRNDSLICRFNTGNFSSGFFWSIASSPFFLFCFLKHLLQVCWNFSVYFLSFNHFLISTFLSLNDVLRMFPQISLSLRILSSALSSLL